MANFRLIFTLAGIVLLGSFSASAQVNAVEFGKNRVQYKKFKWQFYQTRNFNTYFNQNGQELAKFVAQVAEEEAPKIEAFSAAPTSSCTMNLQTSSNPISGWGSIGRSLAVPRSW